MDVVKNYITINGDPPTYDTYCDKRVFCATSDTNTELYCADKEGPNTDSHSIVTSCNANICGVDVPVYATTREWKATTTITYGIPGGPFKFIVTGFIFCGPAAQHYKWQTSISDKVSITTSTLYYLDQRYKVALYRKNIEKLDLTNSTGDRAEFSGPNGTMYVGKAIIKKSDIKVECTEEWHLIIDGVDRIICSSSYNPIDTLRGFLSNASATPPENYTPDEDVELIILTPAISDPQMVPLDPDCRYWGYYDYAGLGAFNELNVADGGWRDYFYPGWCRMLQQDPLWREAADRRFEHSVDSNRINMSDVTQAISIPAVQVDTTPVGSFVRHPVVGDVYQWLLKKRGGGYHLETYPKEEIEEIIRANLPKNIRDVSGELLLFPIGVA